MKLSRHGFGHPPCHTLGRTSRRHIAVLVFTCSAVLAQSALAAVPRGDKRDGDGTVSASPPSASAPGSVASRTFHDPAYKVSFDYPGDWVFARKDGAISTFRLDARTAKRKTTMRAVTAMPANPFPASTFEGAYVYLSVTPRSSASQCEKQASTSVDDTPEPDQIAGLTFAHGHDEQHDICTTERDEIYTTYRNRACYRFDLAINTFCGGAVSGVKDITAQELDQVRARLEAIVATVRFDQKK